MAYRVYSGPPGSTELSPTERMRGLYKEFGMLDDALAWARHVNQSQRVALLIEGDDGTQLDRREIATALAHPESQAAGAR